MLDRRERHWAGHWTLFGKDHVLCPGPRQGGELSNCRILEELPGIQ